MFGLRSAVKAVVSPPQLFPAFVRNASAAKKSVSPLGLLRKRSGFSLSLCKKALAAQDNDVDKAFDWLQEQAQAQGWDKANKLEGRNTAQGLVGLVIEDNVASMVELNCETDFVAKNKEFLTLLREITFTVKTNNNAGDDGVSHLSGQDVGRLNTKVDKSVADLIALNIGQIGENITAKKSVTFAKMSDNHFVTGLTHPSSKSHPDFGFGRFGVLLSLHKDDKTQLPKGETLANLSRQLCQHIIGMNPQSIGNLKDVSTWPKSKIMETVDKVEPKVEDGQEIGEEEHNPYGDFDTTADADGVIDTSETVLIHQPFLLEPERMVRDLLIESGIEVKDFVRFEVGQGV